MCEQCDHHRDRMVAERRAAEHAAPGVRALHLQLAALHERKLEELVSAVHPTGRARAVQGGIALVEK